MEPEMLLGLNFKGTRRNRKINKRDITITPKTNGGVSITVRNGKWECLGDRVVFARRDNYVYMIPREDGWTLSKSGGKNCYIQINKKTIRLEWMSLLVIMICTS